jgi:hypothetical protein
VKFQIGWLTLGGDDNGPDPGPKNADWHKVNIVEVKQIPGKGKRFITQRTSDKVLDECTLTVRSVSNTRYMALKLLCEMGGPYRVVCNHGILNMYITDRSINHSENDKEAPLKTDDGSDYLNTATWTITLQEANDGGSGGDTGVTGNLGNIPELVQSAEG